MRYIDIFAGCGGLSVGLQNAGWQGLFAIEKNRDAFSTLKYNLIDSQNHFNWPEWLDVCSHDIKEVLKKNKDDLEALQGSVDLVAGGPPCQGFSLAGKRDTKDERNKLVKSYLEFIEYVKPKALILENVHGFTVNFKGNRGSIKKYSTYVVEKLEELEYKVASYVVDVSEFGVPQKRKRFILIAMRDKDPELVFQRLRQNRASFCTEHGIGMKTTIREALSDLEKKNGECLSPDSKNFKAGLYGKAESGYQRLMRKSLSDLSTAVDSHRFVNHSKTIVKLHEDLLAKAPAGKRIIPSDGYVENLKRRGVTVLDANAQAPTITSIPDELVHYKEPRILTVREQARIQSFPDWFEFKGKYTSGGKLRKKEVPRYTQVGNAVPPLFAEQVGKAVMEVLQNG